MLSGLQRYRDPGERPKLPGPHAGGVHHHLGLDPARFGEHRAGAPAASLDPGSSDTLDHPHAQLAGAFGQRGGHANRVGPALVGDVKGRQHIVGPGQRPQVG